MIITDLQVQNFKRIKAVRITPDKDGKAVILTGENEAGKSSVIDSLISGLKLTELKDLLASPIRSGEKEAFVQAEFGDWILTRNWTEKGSYLRIKSKVKGVTSPREVQAFLDDLTGGNLLFDPLGFCDLPEAKQAKLLMDLTGVDPSKIDAEKKEIYQERAMINREIAQLKARVDSIPVIGGLPQEEISSAEILTEIQAAEKNNKDIESTVSKMESVKDKRFQASVKISQLQDKITELEKEINDCDEFAKVCELHLESKLAIDISSFTAKMQSIDATNRQIREAKNRAELVARLDAKEKESTTRTERMEALEQQKIKMLAEVDLPLDGLTFDSERIYYNGIPFCQCSGSQKLRVSTGLLVAKMPKLRIVLIKDNKINLLDKKRRAEYLEALHHYGLQVWAESNSDEPDGIVIEDGEVKQ